MTTSSKKFLFDLYSIIFVLFGALVLYGMVNIQKIYPNFSIWMILLLVILWLFFLPYLYCVLVGNCKKPFCKIPTKARVVGDEFYLTIKSGLAHVPDDSYYIVTFEYPFKGRQYQKSILCNKHYKPGTEVDLLVNKTFPRLICTK